MGLGFLAVNFGTARVQRTNTVIRQGDLLQQQPLQGIHVCIALDRQILQVVHHHFRVVHARHDGPHDAGRIDCADCPAKSIGDDFRWI